MKHAILIVLLLLAAATLALAQAPQVVSVSPAQNELNVSVDDDISATFDIDMNETTINSSTFIVNGRSTGLLEGTISYDGPSKTATFDPAADFVTGELIFITLTTGIQSSGGDPLEAPYCWSFSATVNGGVADFTVHLDFAAGESPWSIKYPRDTFK